MTVSTISTTIGHGIELGSGNYGLTLTVAGKGAIQSSSYAMYGPTLSNDEVLINHGLITAAGDGIFLHSPGSVVNSGSISAGDIGAGVIGYFTANENAGRKDYFANTGNISGDNFGVYLYNVTATNAGTITSNNVGVKLTTGTLVNSSSISGGTIGLGVLAGRVTNKASGNISSQVEGVFASSGGNQPLTVANAGHILGGNTGIYLFNASLVNSGTITGDITGAFLKSASGLNSGLISGQTLAVYVGNDQYVIDNSFTNAAGGSISSSEGIGLFAPDDAVVINDGTIYGKVSGVYVEDGSFTNDGLIDSGGIGVAAYNATLIDSGTILGGSYAIAANGSFALDLTNKAVLDGKVVDAAGSGVLNLEGDAQGSLGGLGSSFEGFSTIDFTAGAAWALEGNVAGLAGGQVINGFTLGDTLVVDGFAANSASITAAGLVLDNGGNTITIDLATVPFISDLSISSAGGETTIEFAAAPPPNSIVTSSLPGTITLGEDTVPISLTIAKSGFVAGVKSVPAYGGTLTNFGTVSNIFFSNTTTLSNFGLIAGAQGVTAYQSDILSNAGTIAGLGSAGIGVDLKGSFATLVNSGMITGTGKAIYGSYFNDLFNSGSIAGNLVLEGSSLNNSGMISGGPTYGLGGTSTNIYNTGTIAGPVDGIAQRFGGNITNTGTIAGKAYGITVAGANIIDSGLISGDEDAIYSNDHDPNSGFLYTLSLELDPGARFIGAVDDISGKGTLTLDGTTAGALDMGGSFTGFDAISFAAGAKWRLEGTVDELAGEQKIKGFGVGDTIVLDGFSATSDTYVTGSGLELADGSAKVTLDITGNFNTGNFMATGTPQDTTILEVTCYAAGTRIATPGGDVAVEALEIGDLVRTLHAGDQPVKWIGRRSYDGRLIRGNKAALPICIKAGAIADGVPVRDLWVSPGHAILIDDMLIHASRLINGVSVLQAQVVDTVTYYHIELDTHEIVIAENCPAETFMDEHFRRQFHNADEYRRLYPGEMAPGIMCRKRLDGGFQLRAIQRRLAARAGIAAAEATGKLRGYVDGDGPDRCFGWAQDMAAPEEPVCLDVLADGRRIGRVLANLYRADVAAAGYGSGYQGFEFTFPAGVEGEITVRRSVDDAVLKKAVGVTVHSERGISLAS